MELGNKILKLRKDAKLSQEQLAEKLNVTRQTISNWELGQTAPDINQAKELAKIFRVSLDELTDNDFKDVLVEKISNTEKLAGIVIKLLKVIGVLFLIFIILMTIVVIRSYFNKEDYGRIVSTEIRCNLHDVNYIWGFKFYENNGKIIEKGGNAYIYNILDLKEYDNGYQVIDLIDAYVKNNGGTCEIHTEYDNEN